MVSKRVNESIDAAKKYLDSIGKPGYDPVAMCDSCDIILSNIKAFIHNDVIWDKIQSHETKVHKEVAERIKKANDAMKNKPPMEIWEDGMDHYIKIRHWQSLEMLNFYDKLSREADI